jgi:predicted nucleic acid-binding protein
MTACDTNILFYSVNRGCPENEAARAFLADHAANREFAIGELNLMELYVLLRNPKLNRRPASAGQAMVIINGLRGNPCWRVIDYPGSLMDQIWAFAGQDRVAYRAIFDARIALTLLHHGVTEFATRNVKDFKGFPFARIWDPLAS